jgi:hypothetical protein
MDKSTDNPSTLNITKGSQQAKKVVGLTRGVGVGVGVGLLVGVFVGVLVFVGVFVGVCDDVLVLVGV